MTNRLMAHPVTKTVVLISLAAAGVITACHSAHDASRTKDISTDLGGKGVTYYYKINGDEIVRSRCQAGESTPSFCQEDSKSVPLDRFKAALGLRTNSIDEAQRQRLYGVLASGIFL